MTFSILATEFLCATFCEYFNILCASIYTDTTPPVVAYCPGDLDVESYSYDETTFVTWDTPRFTDNSMAEVDVVSTHTQGQFVDGIHNITYIGIDESGNKAMCTFLLAVIHRSMYFLIL